MHGYRDEVVDNAVADEPGAEDLLALFFERSETSIAKGREFIERIFTRPRIATSARILRPATLNSMPSRHGASLTQAA